MDGLTALGLAFEQPIDMGHATDITQSNHIGIALSQIARLSLPDGCADACILNGKKAAKATTLVGSL